LNAQESRLPDSTPIISRVKYNFEKALTFANGDYIFFSDQDDEWLPNKLEKQVKFFEDSKDNKLGLVSCGANLINNSLKTF
jgi:hypothetical protein